MSELHSIPRLLVAGMSGGSGKTMVSLGFLHSLRRAGIAVRGFKKGPDYIDAAWLSWAAGGPARNLDTFLMRPECVVSSFTQNGVTEGVNVIEAARGLFDGFDIGGTHSSAALSKLLTAPIVLIVNATKITRTAAALVFGCQKFDPELSIRGVILNNVNGRRHEQILRGAIESACSIPVLGAIPKASLGQPLPERHLGLIPPQEHRDLEQLRHDLLQVVGDNINLDALLAIARSAPPLETSRGDSLPVPRGGRVRIGYLKDSAFSFYYPENLEQLEQGGAELVPVSTLEAVALPEDLNALYIGGGFPETHAAQLAGNRSFLRSVLRATEEGLPVYAECGGLMLLARALLWKGSRYEMAGVFPFDVEVSDTAQGHGYTQLYVDRPNPFFPPGLSLLGHEFHYSHIVPQGHWPLTACEVRRGTGCFPGRDAATIRNVWASYTHLHALATPEWVKGMLDAARNFVPQPIQ